jgi:FkbM family methyltransferase
VIKAFNLALGERSDSLDLFDYATKGGSTHATLVGGVIEEIYGKPSAATRVPMQTLDGFLCENALAHIDLLKVDTEGYELRVLQGATRLLSDKRIRAVQFEFGEIDALTHTFVQDILDLLGPAFRVFRLLPRGLLELGRQSRWQREQFAYQNLVALLKPDRDGPSATT